MWFSDYGTAFFFKADHQYKKKTIEEKETYLVKMRIPCHPFVSFLFIPIADFSLFVANQTKVESNHYMNVFKPRKRESNMHACMCARFCECACVSLLYSLLVFVGLFVFVGLVVFVCQCLSVLFALSNCFRLQKKASGCVRVKKP